MIHKTLIGTAALFGLFALFRTTDNLVRTILTGQIMAIGLAFHEGITTTGFFLFMMALVLTIIYGMAKKNFTAIKRSLIIIPAVLSFTLHFLQLQHYPGTGLTGLIMKFSIIALLLPVTMNTKGYKNELGFLVIVAVDAATGILKQL